MHSSFPDEGVTQQVLVLTAAAWTGMLLLTFQPERLYRRWRALEVAPALLTVASIVACTILLGMMTYSDAALLGGGSLVAGACGVRALRRRFARHGGEASDAVSWRRRAAKQHVA